MSALRAIECVYGGVDDRPSDCECEWIAHPEDASRSQWVCGAFLDLYRRGGGWKIVGFPMSAPMVVRRIAYDPWFQRSVLPRDWGGGCRGSNGIIVQIFERHVFELHIPQSEAGGAPKCVSVDPPADQSRHEVDLPTTTASVMPLGRYYFLNRKAVYGRGLPDKVCFDPSDCNVTGEDNTEFGRWAGIAWCDAYAAPDLRSCARNPAVCFGRRCVRQVSFGNVPPIDPARYQGGSLPSGCADRQGVRVCFDDRDIWTSSHETFYGVASAFAPEVIGGPITNPILLNDPRLTPDSDRYPGASHLWYPVQITDNMILQRLTEQDGTSTIIGMLLGKQAFDVFFPERCTADNPACLPSRAFSGLPDSLIFR